MGHCSVLSSTSKFQPTYHRCSTLRIRRYVLSRHDPTTAALPECFLVHLRIAEQNSYGARYHIQDISRHLFQFILCRVVFQNYYSARIATNHQKVFEKILGHEGEKIIGAHQFEWDPELHGALAFVASSEPEGSERANESKEVYRQHGVQLPRRRVDAI